MTLEIGSIDTDLLEFVVGLQAARNVFASLPTEQQEQLWDEARAHVTQLKKAHKGSTLTSMGGAAAYTFLASVGLQAAKGQVPQGLNLFAEGETESCAAMGHA